MRCLLATIAAFGIALPAHATWRVAESAHFRVYAEMSSDALRKRAELLEDYRDLLGKFTTAQPDAQAPKLDVYLVDRITQAVPFGKVGANVGGFYTASDAGMAAFALKGDYGQKLLLHEYAHHHMFASRGQAYPAWYVEGFAEYFMTASFAPRQVDFGLVDPGRARRLSGTWLAWDKVIARDTPGMIGGSAGSFYAQSWLLTHYLYRAPGMAEKLGNHLQAIGRGDDPLAAFKTHVTADLDGLDKVMRRYVASKDFTFSRVSREPPTPPAVTVRDLPASADDLLMFRAWLDTRGAAVRDRTAALAEIQAAAARHPGDDLAIRTHAMAELFLGDPAKASALLAGPLAQAPDDPELLRLQAMALLRQDRRGNLDAAQRLIVKAVRLAPADWRAMHVYVHTNPIETQPSRESLFNVVQRTWELAPQANGIVIDMAAVLVQAGRLADAAKVLEPVAFAPHGQGISRMARLLRSAALAGDKKLYVQLMTARPTSQAPADVDEGPPENKPA